MLLTLFLLTAAHTAPLRTLPQLGDPVPGAVLKARAGTRTCAVGENHHDPCATTRIHHGGDDDRVTIAWDATSHTVTFLYSTTLQTDDDLAAGTLGRIDISNNIQPFLDGFVSPDWCDTDTNLSGDALWCAVMKPAPRHQGRVLGFVQSIYLLLPDAEAVPLYRTSTPRHRIRHGITSGLSTRHLERRSVASPGPHHSSSRPEERGLIALRSGETPVFRRCSYVLSNKTRAGTV